LGGGGGTDDDDEAREELVEDILTLIRDTIQPDSWRENGGDPGAIAELNGQLIVTQTAGAHEELHDLLKQLREAKRMAISVEGRFLTITTNFLEETGVDLDVVLNNGNAGFDTAVSQQGGALIDPATGATVLVPRQLSRMGFIPAVPAGLGTPLTGGLVPLQPYQQAGLVPQNGSILPQSGQTTPIPISQNSLSLTRPRNTGIPGSLGDAVANTPAMQIFGSFLDNLQVDFLIRATQADRRSSTLEAPRIVIPNGETQRASISDGVQQSFVAAGAPIVASGVAAVLPIPQQQLFGRTLTLRGWISADRRYVTLDIRLSTSVLLSLTTFEAVQGSSGGGVGGGGAVGGFFLQLPEVQTTTIDTRVAVPDGGTLLLGGIKRAAEVQAEAGVPVLSKIPVIKRAFSNRSDTKDEITTLILLTPKILIQRELEEEAFPGLTPPDAG
jgi:type II secretory pathway component GspD/PulD (secretin)